MNRTVGAGTFRKAFGTAQAARADVSRNCVRAFAVEEHENRHAVVEACEESTTTRRAFATAYGEGRNAYGKCVSTHARAQNDEEPAA